MRDHRSKVDGGTVVEANEIAPPVPGRQSLVSQGLVSQGLVSQGLVSQGSVAVEAKESMGPGRVTAEPAQPVPQMPSYASIRALFADRRVQAKGDVNHGAATVHAAAAEGISGPGTQLPHLERIQRSFGKHDVSHVQAHQDARAVAGARAMNAEAFATGDHVAFAGAPSLHTAAHEAAHVIQQRGDVQLKGGVGEVGDKYEQHADAVADAVVRGESAEMLLDQHAGGSGSSGVQMQEGSGGNGVQAEPPAEARSEQRGQVLARLLEQWRAAGLLDPPARPRDVEAFSPIAPPRTGAIRASNGQAVIASALPASVPGVGPGPAPAPGPARPTLRVIPGGRGLPAPAPEAGPSLLAPALIGIAVFLIVVLWPNETAPPWMDEMSPITGAPYGSADEYEWTKRLSPKQVDYLRRLTRERENGPVATNPNPGPAEHAAPNPAPGASPVPLLDGENDERRLPDIDFYHGTDQATAASMVGGEAIKASGHGEFGNGFYTFLVEAAAAEAARLYTRPRPGVTAWGVVDFAVPPAVMAEFFAASEIAALLAGKLSRILVFPDKKTPVTVRYPHGAGGAEISLNWTDFIEENKRLGKNTAWPYDLIIGPLKGKLRSQKAGVDQWVFGADGVMVFNVPSVRRRMVASGSL